MRILVTGGSGMVGSYVSSVFDDARCLLTGRDSLDICNKDNVLNITREFKPDAILHLAAATDVDRCELDKDWAFKTNVVGTQNMTLAAKLQGATLVFLSSGSVFDGSKPTPYTELDSPNPINFYGKTKLEAENVIIANLRDYLIIRAGWMIGGGKRDLKFVGKITQKMLELHSIKVVNDKFGSLTYAKDLLSGIKNLLTIGKTWLYHMVNRGMVSRYDIALKIKKILLLKDVEILPVNSNFFPLPAPRGRSEALENFRLKQLNLDCMRSWNDALKEYLLKDYNIILNKICM